MTDENPAVPTQSGITDNQAGALAYLFGIPAIFFLISEPYNKNPFIRFHSWQSIALIVGAIGLWVVLFILGTILSFTIFLAPIVLIVDLLVALGLFVLWIFAVINAYKGIKYKIPVIGNFAEKQANS